LVILDLVDDPDRSATLVKVLKDGAADLESEITVIGVSSVMTWARTQSSKDAGSSLSEQDYKTRKASVKYKGLRLLETTFLSSNTDNLSVYVVAAGIVYGQGTCNTPLLIGSDNSSFLR
jgi:hypothetical protein